MFPSKQKSGPHSNPEDEAEAENNRVHYTRAVVSMRVPADVIVVHILERMKQIRSFNGHELTASDMLLNMNCGEI